MLCKYSLMKKKVRLLNVIGSNHDHYQQMRSVSGTEMNGEGREVLAHVVFCA